jgi:voltage-gated potassium channel
VVANPLSQLRRVLFFAIFVVVIGVVGYRITANLSWLDSLYMTVITLSTVGFREVGPGLDTDAKLFTVFLILGGAGFLAFSIKTTTEVLMDDATKHFFYQRSILKRLDKMRDHYIVCGLGRVGRSVCEELVAEEVAFIAVERDAEEVRYAQERGWGVLHGDGTYDRVLEMAGIDRAKGLMSCVDSDANNLLLIMTARALAPTIVISARVSEERNLSKFKRAGANHIYSPFSLLGRRMTRAITQPRVTELLDLALEESNYDLNLGESVVSEHSEVVGQTLVECDFRKRYGAVILSIIRSDHSILHNPPADTKVLAGDILVALGTPDQLKALKLEMSCKSPKKA